ncbi:MAG TPA: ABC transporter permease [Actinomycetota bacterium]|nr:ABC transporter permease [Actinomycetota bacterium]
MLKRIQLRGVVTFPEHREMPEIGSIVTIGETRFEVVGLHEQKQQRADGWELVYTASTRLLDGARIVGIEAAPSPLFDGEEA